MYPVHWGRKLGKICFTFVQFSSQIVLQTYGGGIIDDNYTI
jgi:hypothetical protein